MISFSLSLFNDDDDDLVVEADCWLFVVDCILVNLLNLLGMVLMVVLDRWLRLFIEVFPKYDDDDDDTGRWM